MLSAAACRGGGTAGQPLATYRGSSVSPQWGSAAALPIRARTRGPGLPHNVGHDG